MLNQKKIVFILKEMKTIDKAAYECYSLILHIQKFQ